VISGIVVATRPEALDEVGREIDALEYANVHYTDPRGKLVVTIEAPGVEASMKRVEAIGRMRRVLSVSLAEYCLEGDETDEPNPLRPDARPDRSDAVPRNLESQRAAHDRRDR